MASINLSPDNINVLDLSSFCEQMDQMYFSSPSSSSVYKSQHKSTCSTGNFKRAPIKASAAERVSVQGLVSALDSIHLESPSEANSPRRFEVQPEAEFVPAHSAKLSQRSLVNTQQHARLSEELFDSTTVDWCGQPTAGLQWVKTTFLPQPRAASASSARPTSSAATRPPPRSRPSSAAPPTELASEAPSPRLGGASSRASISAEYRSLTDAEVARDVAVLHLGGSAVDPERRLWTALMRRRRFPIRKTLSAASRRDEDRQLEFVSLFGPVAEKRSRDPRRSASAAAASAASEPPPGTPSSSRPATAASAVQVGGGHQRPLTGRPRPPPAVAAAVAATTFNGFNEAAAAGPHAAGPPPSSSDRRQHRRRQSAAEERRRPWLRRPPGSAAALSAAAPAASVELALLGNRFKYPSGAARTLPAASRQRGALASGSSQDPAVSELARIVRDANRRRPELVAQDGNLEGDSASRPPDVDRPADDQRRIPTDTPVSDQQQRPQVDSSEREARAARTIQSSYRGYGTRRQLELLDRQARGQGFESLNALQRCYSGLIQGSGPAAGSGRRSSRPFDAQELQAFLDDKRRIELAFDTTIRCPARRSQQQQQQQALPPRPSTQDMMKVLNVCGQFPSRQAVEQAMEERRLMRRCHGDQRGTMTLDKTDAVEIFYRVLHHTGRAAGASPRSPRPGPPPPPPPPQPPASTQPQASEQPLAVRIKVQWSRDC